MAKLPSQKRISREDLSEADSWIVRLLNPLNSFMESIYYALNRNLTFKDNIQSRVYEFSFSTASDYTSNNTFSEINVSKGFKEKANGVLILQIYEKDKQYDPITESISIDWIEINQNIRIKFISGLDDSKNYVCRILII